MRGELTSVKITWLSSNTRKDPFADTPYLKNTKARTELIPPALDAAGLPGFPYQQYHEIAAIMKPEEIHPEVREKLDVIMEAFGL